MKKKPEKELTLNILRNLVTEMESDSFDDISIRGFSSLISISVYDHGSGGSRSEARCNFSKEDCAKIRSELLVGAGSKNQAIAYLKERLKEAQKIIICDPYFLKGYNNQQPHEYISTIDNLITEKVMEIELFVNGDSRYLNDTIASAFNDICENRKIKVTYWKTDKIHDRVWIVSPEDKGYVVGTSFNGLGNKCAFILELPTDDLVTFSKELESIRKSSNA